MHTRHVRLWQSWLHLAGSLSNRNARPTGTVERWLDPSRVRAHCCHIGLCCAADRPALGTTGNMHNTDRQPCIEPQKTPTHDYYVKHWRGMPQHAALPHTATGSIAIAAAARSVAACTVHAMAGRCITLACDAQCVALLSLAHSQRERARVHATATASHTLCNNAAARRRQSRAPPLGWSLCSNCGSACSYVLEGLSWMPHWQGAYVLPCTT